MKAKDAKAIWASIHRIKPNIDPVGYKIKTDDIASYRFLAIDIDNAPKIKGAAATDGERGRVYALFHQVLEELLAFEVDSLFLKTPLKMATGNGYCLLFPIDLPYDEKTYELMSRLGVALANRYQSEYASIDTAVVKDPSRILGVVGTVNNNKTDIPEDDRIGQIRRIVGFAPAYRPMPADEFIRWAEAYISQYGQTSKANDEIDFDAFENNAKPNATGGGKELLQKVVSAYLSKCDPAIQGSNGDKHTFIVAGHCLAFQIEERDESLSIDEVVDLMESSGWNGKCSPPWGLSELRKKVASADRNGSKPATKYINLSKPNEIYDKQGDRWDTQSFIDEISKEDGKAKGVPSNLVGLDTIKPKRLRWLWPDRLPLGNIALLYGDPGKGKSTLTLDIIATVSRDGTFPDGTKAEQGECIVITGEDNIADTVVPRLMAADANLKNIKALSMVGYDDNKWLFTLKEVGELKRELDRLGNPKLIVIDPMSAYLAGQDSHKDADIRQLMTPLKEVAEDYGICILLVTHMTKANKTSAIYKALGSIGIVGAARVAYLVCEDKNDPDRRLMLPTKSNVSKIKTGLAFTVESKYIDIDGEEQSVGKIHWSDEVIAISADDALTGEDDNSPKMQEAKDFLYQQLAAGSRKSTEIYRLAEQQGISETTIKRARKDMGIKSYQINGLWYMALPDGETEDD